MTEQERAWLHLGLRAAYGAELTEEEKAKLKEARAEYLIDYRRKLYVENPLPGPYAKP